MPLDLQELREIRDVAQRIAMGAGDLLLTGWRSGDPQVRKKGAIDLVTDYDLRSEELLRRQLEDAFPTDAIVGEEGDPTGNGDRIWYVDPIDGTTNFAHGHFFFCVSLGLVDADERAVGIVHAPALGTTWTAARGLGTERNGERVSVSTTRSLDEALAATGFPYDRRETEDDNVRETAAALARVQGIRRCGSAALDLALVADGTYDLFWEQTLGPWDGAGGAALVDEAGGRVTGYGGDPFDLRAGHVVATNGPLHDAVLALLREARVGLPPPRGKG